MTLGSLFDGIGGFPLAASRFGIKPVWASEIEPVPISITKKHFPDMEHLGDITKINGADITPVDIITFGSPCQDLSVAGKRAGLKGERSGLFLEAVRIIKEMRKKTNGRKPARIIWENVPGAFSSNGGEDFRIVLQELATIGAGGASIPRPSQEDGDIVWFNAGAVMGDGWSIAWRVLDAQYWGVPQRRRRIFLVADFTGQRAAEILFKPESESGDSAESGAQGEETAGNTGNSVKTPVYCIATKRANAGDNQLAVVIGVDGHNQNLTHNVVNTLRGGRVDKDNIGLIILNDQGDGNLPIVYDARGYGDGKIVNTLTGDHENRITDYTALAVHQNQCGEARIGEKTNTLNTNNASGRNAPLVAYCLQGNMIGRDDKNGPQGSGVSKDLCFTLNTVDRHAVAVDCRNDNVSDVSGTLQAKSNGGQSLNYINPVFNGYSVRRLTPLECERLMGFPEIAELEVTKMTKDEYIAFNLANGNIIADKESGKVYATRRARGIRSEYPIELTGTILNGYRIISIRNGQFKMQCRVHRIIWISENGVLPDGYCIDHVNNDKLDNRLCNLQLLTKEQNSTKAAIDGLYRCAEFNPSTKVCPEKHTEIISLYKTGEFTMRELANRYGISKSRIQQIIHVSGWTEYGHDGKKISDSTRYKALGNSVAIPCVEFIISRILEVM